MDTALANAHSLWRYVVLLAAVVAIGNLWRGWLSNATWRPLDARLSLFCVTVLDLQLVLGLLLWIVGHQWESDDITLTWRHPILMATIWGVVRIGWFRLHQLEIPNARFRTGAIWFSGATLLLLISLFQIAR